MAPGIIALASATWLPGCAAETRSGALTSPDGAPEATIDDARADRPPDTSTAPDADRDAGFAEAAPEVLVDAAPTDTSPDPGADPGRIDTTPEVHVDSASVDTTSPDDGANLDSDDPADPSCPDGALPTDEICDGIDNDCDGLTDEDPAGLPLSVPCYPYAPATQGAGVCVPGSYHCLGHSGYSDDCDGAIGPGEELCNGLDDDCDAATDEAPDDPNVKMSLACYSGPPETLQSPCGEGLTTCLGAAGWGGCEGEVLPVAESCDGLDSDCDGIGDADEPGPGGAPEDSPCNGVPYCDGEVCYCQQSALGSWECILE